MKKNALAIASIVLNVVLLWTVYLLNGDVKNLRSYVHSELHNVEYTISQDISRIETAIDRQQLRHESYALEPAGVDKKQQKLLAEAVVTLKEWSSDTAVTLRVTQQGNTESLLMETKGDGRFTVPVAISTQSGDIRLSALITTGGITTEEELGIWGDISMLLPLQMSGWGWGDPQFEEGALTLRDHSAGVQDRNGIPMEACETEFYVYVNGELGEKVSAAPLEDDDLTQYWMESCTLSRKVSLGDEIAVSFACRDAYGLHYEFPLYTWEVVETQDQSAFTAVGGSNTPTLTWK